MVKQPSNSDLAHDIKGVKADIKDIKNTMQRFHDFMIVQQDRQNPMRGSKGNINWAEVAKQALVLLTVIAGIFAFVIEVLVKRIQQ